LNATVQYILNTATPLRCIRHQLEDTRWQPSKLELEAQLGAAREREHELQWRLQQAEEALRQQVHPVALAWRVHNGDGGVPLCRLLYEDRQLGRASTIMCFPRPCIETEEDCQLLALQQSSVRV